MFSPSSHKTILVIGCDSTGEEQFFTNESAFTAWCQHELDLGMIARVQPLLLQSAVIGMDVVPGLARQIKKHWKQVQGVVCILPSENFLQTASALAFAMGDCGKPIVCVTDVSATQSSNHRNAFRCNGLRLYVMNAVQIATAELSGVLVSSGSEVIPATHASIIGHQPRIVAADRVVYAHVDFGIRLTHHSKPRHDRPLSVNVANSRRVEYIDAQHAERLEEAFSRVTKKPSGVIVFHANRSARERVAALVPKNILALFVESDHALIHAKGGWERLDCLTIDAAVAKFLWVLGQSKTSGVKTAAAVVIAMRNDVIGETLL